MTTSWKKGGPRVGIPSGADIGYEIAKEPFVILFDIDAALFLGSVQGVGDALSTVLRYIRDRSRITSSSRHTSICSGFL